jgi:hypothetical protein
VWPWQVHRFLATLRKSQNRGPALTELAALCEQVVKTFLMSGATYEVNVSSRAREQAVRKGPSLTGGQGWGGLSTCQGAGGEGIGGAKHTSRVLHTRQCPHPSAFKD